MNHDQRIALLQAACMMATGSGTNMEHSVRGRVLFYYVWLQKIVQSPYDVPNQAEQAQLLRAERMEDMGTP